MQPTIQDLVHGVDFTALAVAGASDFNQVVDVSTPASDKGFIVTTEDIGESPVVPNPDTSADTLKWKRYIWRRVGLSSVTAYVWNDNAAPDGAYLKWQPITVASIPSGVITEDKIANNAVTNIKIVSLAYAKLIGAPSQWYNVGDKAAGGDLTGDYPSPTIGIDKVTTTKLQSHATDDALRAVNTNHIKTAAITLAKIAPHTIGKFILRTKSDFSAVEWVRNYFSELETIGTTGQIPIVVDGAVAWATPTGTAGSLVKTYDSAVQTLSTGAQSYTFAHGLAGVPDGVFVYLQCKADASVTHGYAVGTKIPISQFIFGAGGAYWAVNITTSQIAVSKRSGAVDFIGASGALKQPTDTQFVADWEIVVKAFKFQ